MQNWGPLRCQERPLQTLRPGGVSRNNQAPWLGLSSPVARTFSDSRSSRGNHYCLCLQDSFSPKSSSVSVRSSLRAFFPTSTPGSAPLYVQSQSRDWLNLGSAVICSMNEKQIVQGSKVYTAVKGPSAGDLILSLASNPRGAHSLLFLIMLGHKWNPQQRGVGSGPAGMGECISQPDHSSWSGPGTEAGCLGVLSGQEKTLPGS